MLTLDEKWTDRCAFCCRPELFSEEVMLHACSPAAQLAIVPASSEGEEGEVHASLSCSEKLPI